MQRSVGVFKLYVQQRRIRQQQVLRRTLQFYLDMRLGRDDIFIKDMYVIKSDIEIGGPAVSFYIHGLVGKVIAKVLLRLVIVRICARSDSGTPMSVQMTSSGKRAATSVTNSQDGSSMAR